MGFVVLPHVGSSRTRNHTCVPCIARQIPGATSPLDHQGRPHPCLLNLYLQAVSFKLQTRYAAAHWLLLTTHRLKLGLSLPFSSVPSHLLSQPLPSVSCKGVHKLRPVGQIQRHRVLGMKVYWNTPMLF